MMARVAMGSDGAAIAVDPSLAMETYFVPQGIGADLIATRTALRRDQADALAVQSQAAPSGPGTRGALPGPSCR